MPPETMSVHAAASDFGGEDEFADDNVQAEQAEDGDDDDPGELGAAPGAGRGRRGGVVRGRRGGAAAKNRSRVTQEPCLNCDAIRYQGCR